MKHNQYIPAESWK